MNRDNIPKFVGIGLILFLLSGLGYGLWHDFTPEYEATHKYGPPQYVYNEKTDTIHPYKAGDPYPTEIFTDENGNGHTTAEWANEFRGRSKNYIIKGNKIVALTKLNEKDMKIQEEKGCTPCHPK